MSIFTTQKRTKRRKISRKHAFYEKLREFRIRWETAGGNRGTLRRARKSLHTLFPPPRAWLVGDIIPAEVPSDG